MSKLKNLLLSCAILFVLTLASFAVQYWSNKIAPHDDRLLSLALRGMMEFGLIMGIITAVVMLVEDYTSNNGNEFFSTPARTILNLIYVPFGVSLMVLLPSFLLFLFIFHFLGETFSFFSFLFGPTWEFKNMPEFYLYGGATTLWYPILFIKEYIKE